MKAPITPNATSPNNSLFPVTSPLISKASTSLSIARLSTLTSPFPTLDYTLVGAAHGISAHSVSRDISYAINKADGLHSKLSELTGAHIPRTDIHNGFVIAVFARLIRRNAFLNSPD